MVAVSGLEGPRTIRLRDMIQKREVSMLIDSGSSHSFVNKNCPGHLSGICRTHKPLTVKIADGGTLTCNQEMSSCEWWVQGVSFCTDLKVLPLSGYDVILGMDCLEANCPMTVHWRHKLLTFEYQGQLVTLSGILSGASDCSMVTASELHNLAHREAISKIIQLCSVETETSEAPVPPVITSLL